MVYIITSQNSPHKWPSTESHICPKLATRVYAHGTHRQAGMYARNHKFNQNKPIKTITTEIVITCAQDRAHVLS